jgi:rSAM/selenodomain-associated transferase 2
MLGDIDRPEDLGLWQEAVRSEEGETISVIVPAINEESNIAALAENLAYEQNIEIIVADGGSSDGTALAAGALASKVVKSEQGRWVQMNAGSEAASGEVLLFLHADTRLPAGFSGYIRRALDDPDAVAGAFRFATDLDTVSMKLIEWAANMRASRLGIIYSDQALFIRSCLFRELGGFPDQPIMEDFELTRRVRARGKTVLLPYKAVSSARRWETVGTWKLTVIHYIITGAYLLGVSPERLAGWYRGVTGYKI